MSDPIISMLLETPCNSDQARVFAAAKSEIERLRASLRATESIAAKMMNYAAERASADITAVRKQCAAIAAPESIQYSDEEWRVRCEIRDAILGA